MHNVGGPAFRDHWKFALAREFVMSSGQQAPYSHQKSALERLGDRMVLPLVGTADWVLKNIKKPLTITAIAITLMLAVTIIFYPTSFVGAMALALPKALAITPEKVKFALYLLTEITILGLGLRALGRFCNADLVQKWKTQEVVPIPIGAIRV